MNRKKFIEPRCVSRAVSPNAQRGFCFLHRYSMKKEIWKTIDGYENYQVSSLGRVKSLNYNKTGKEKLLKPLLNNRCYYHVVLCKNGVGNTKKIHQLVAIAFLNHIPCGHKLVVDHINDNTKDNRVENLQIITQRENVCRNQGRYSSLYKGVCFDKSTKKWMSRIVINGKTNYLGLFTCEIEASNAYQNKLKTL